VTDGCQFTDKEVNTLLIDSKDKIIKQKELGEKAMANLEVVLETLT
jgi:hypothetical protein